jgi:uncharacterized protein (DUF1697 family)
MTDLRAMFDHAGARNVRTVIASGNVLFEAAHSGLPAIVAVVKGSIAREMGRPTEIMVRAAGDLRRLADADPFAVQRVPPDVKRYVAFLARAPKKIPALPMVSRKEGLEVIAVSGRDAFVISRRKDNGMYGFPNLTIEEQLGVPATSRNWNTVEKLIQLIGD